ncbi:MAG: aldo/keto reductase [Xanthobacteraceae bacterium]|nr:aldo/keto reductase [Xanthobacteraceae bacterium]
MKTRPFGPAAPAVSVIGQGTWNLELAPRADALRTLARGIDLGMTHIDTAEMYGSGRAEALAGEAIAGKRDKVFVVSKVLPSNASRKGTLAACERSLKQLKTDYLDCYLLHWRGSYPLSETFAAFEELKAAGRIRSWGVSNFDEDDLEEALKVAGKGRIACNQVLYHLRERSIEHAVIPCCERNDIAVVAYSPFGQSAMPPLSSPGGKALAEIADARDATPRQVALAFLTRRKSVFAIPKASKVAHTEENAGAGSLELTAQEIENIEKAFPLGRPRSLPML